MSTICNRDFNACDPVCNRPIMPYITTPSDPITTSGSRQATDSPSQPAPKGVSRLVASDFAYRISLTCSVMCATLVCCCLYSLAAVNKPAATLSAITQKMVVLAPMFHHNTAQGIGLAYHHLDYGHWLAGMHLDHRNKIPTFNHWQIKSQQPDPIRLLNPVVPGDMMHKGLRTNNLVIGG